jgi:hypothetical protein
MHRPILDPLIDRCFAAAAHRSMIRCNDHRRSLKSIIVLQLPALLELIDSLHACMHRRSIDQSCIDDRSIDHASMIDRSRL